MKINKICRERNSIKGNQNSFKKQAYSIFTPKITIFSLHVWNKGTLSVPALLENSEKEKIFLSFSLRL